MKVHQFIAGWSSPVARQAHNLKVIGSNPIPATKITLLDQRSRRVFRLHGNVCALRNCGNWNLKSSFPVKRTNVQSRSGAGSVRRGTATRSGPSRSLNKIRSEAPARSSYCPLPQGPHERTQRHGAQRQRERNQIEEIRHRASFMRSERNEFAAMDSLSRNTFSGRGPVSRKALAITISEEADIATAAISGVT